MYWLLVVASVFGPMAIGFFVALRGTVRGWARMPWLIGWAYCFIPACYLSFQSLCSHISGTCPSSSGLKTAEEARVALAALLLGLVVLGISRAVSSVGARAACGIAFMVLVGFSELWMYSRLKEQDGGIAGFLCLALLAWALLAEFAAYRAARRAARLEHEHEHAGHDHPHEHDAAPGSTPA